MLAGDQRLAFGQRWQLPIAAVSGTALLTLPPRAGKSRGKTIRDQFRAIACGCSGRERSLLPVDALSASSSSPCALPDRLGPRRGWLFLPRDLRNFPGHNWPVKAGPNWKNCEALFETVLSILRVLDRLQSRWQPAKNRHPIRRQPCGALHL